MELKNILFCLCSCFVFVSKSTPVGGKNRLFYIGIVEEDWDYAPSGRNLIDNRDPGLYINSSSNRIGRIYQKALYREFTDGSFHTKVEGPEYLGILGPTIRAEVGDIITVKLKNMASFPFTAHPHGAFYRKDDEGALYKDKTSGYDKADDYVLPGDTFTYIWTITDNFAPESGDPNCIPFMYHSHINTPYDTNSGLMGVLLVCKPGNLNEDGERTDVDQEFAFLMTIMDESLSHYLTKNFRKCGDPSECARLNKKRDPVFAESNRMHAINGYVFGNMPPIDMCEGDHIAIYVLGMGSEMDPHTLHFNGQFLQYDLHSAAAVEVFPAIFVAASMVPKNPGQWSFGCNVLNHVAGGMEAFYNVTECPTPYLAEIPYHQGRNRHTARHDIPYSQYSQRETRTHNVPVAPKREKHGPTRQYYIGVINVYWNYGPSGQNKITGGSLTAVGSASSTYFEKGRHRIGGVYKKAKFAAYTDGAFEHVEHSPEHFGILGPLISGEVGDRLEIELKNNADRNFSLVGEGVHFDSRFSEGSGYHAAPGETKKYVWTVPSEGLTDEDPDCVVRMYYSGVDTIRDINTGLIGPLLICKKNKLHANHMQVDIDEQFFLMFSTFDENLSWYIQENINAACEEPSTVNPIDAAFVESNHMSGINGRLYGNLDGLDMCVDDSVVWHVFGMGTQVDVHTVYFHGQSFVTKNSRHDTQLLLPGASADLLMKPDNPGKWLLTCHTDRYVISGMEARFNVDSCGNLKKQNAVSGNVRRYFIRAEEVDWNYAEKRRNIMSGGSLDDPAEEGNIYVRDDDQYIGSTYRKAIFKEYTDATFSTRKHRSEADVHLGMNGPRITAEVGDLIEIVFENNASRPYTIQPHGVFYDKASEGSKYQDNSYISDRGGVAPGLMKTYRWKVTERAGPASEDPNCIPWLYFSGADQVRDPHSGLFGPIIICRDGTLSHNGERKDVDREFILTFSIINENTSWYLKKNIALHAKSRLFTNYSADRDFVESNKMHSINGKIFGNNKGLRMYEGEKVVWYILGFGSDVDIHTVHFHGHSFVKNYHMKQRNDVITVYPGGSVVTEMFVDNPGIYLLHCHVNDHIRAGMETVYEIISSSTRWDTLVILTQPPGCGYTAEGFWPSTTDPLRFAHTSQQYQFLATPVRLMAKSEELKHAWSGKENGAEGLWFN